MSNWNVPMYSQRTPEICWEACAHMLFDWRHAGNPAMQAGYAAMMAGIQLRGLTHQQMDLVYTRLGFRTLRNPAGANIRHALGWSPVIATWVDQAMGHAMVVKGHQHGRYIVANPCARQEIDFGTGANSCVAGELRLAQAEFDNKLGDHMW